jgi:hypothetical protein
MSDAAVNNDQWSDILDIQTIDYPPNWLRFDDTAKLSQVVVRLGFYILENS